MVSRAHRSLIAAHNSVAEQAREHPHGWGIGYFQSGDAYVIKSETAAAECESFRRAADQLASHTLVAHVRRATVGEVGPLNTHPFRNGRWIFAHNGTVFDFDRIEGRMREATPADLLSRRLGSTDTELLFFFLLGRLADAGIDPEGRSPTMIEPLAGAIVSAMESLHRWSAESGAQRPVVNFLLTNGRAFVAHRDGRELYFATQKSRCRDSETCAEREKPCLLDARPHERVNHLLVASERIGDEDRWEEVPDRAIVALAEDFRLRVWSYGT